MAFAGMNYLAVIAAAVAAWLFGALWYMALSKPWMAASGWKSDAEMLGPSGKVSPVPFVIAFVAELVMAYFLAGLIAHLGEVTIWRALVTAIFVWLAFVITTLVVNYRFGRRTWALTAIDGAHWLGVLLVMGLVIGLFGISPTLG
jgi:hypothetical protein